MPRSAAAVVTGYPDPGVHRNLARPIERRRDWRAEMSEADIARFELLAGDLLGDLGYPQIRDPRSTGADRESLRLDLVRARGDDRPPASGLQRRAPDRAPPRAGRASG